ncbi:MAG: hypothetical protein A3A80_02980 [Candidatus Terrybacteria bacterium RIFCSPLOWO2_01_FULL_44_24]|uniref:Uncharacterized protein n=1 Tax=Candidatus Terrybacteria bacterium RIFCSPHIGHO2_01_FULL_43_35 TaxID=1802361 RepID=A0A1G2PF22_9BACT|nr:MAG: hypothetical protein A2828_03165 [Candidatus Terrybacteria bacterium RIFCSPHIGHO2_01_FULL_43_35]OHA51028.1 MAG: hypothetical protein A3A80_02980 [Candidatus Terrybacteria bacterium RIFCSPLOWO2_01_FULL_44_24]
MKENLNSKIWYRALKVLFVFIAASGFLTISLFGYALIPHGDLYYDVHCSNGTRVATDIEPTFGLPNERVDHGNIRCSHEELTQEQRLVPAGGGGRIYDASGNFKGLPDLAYTYSYEYKLAKQQDYVHWLGGLGISLLVWTFVLWLTKRTFFYVVLGEPFIRFRRI